MRAIYFVSEKVGRCREPWVAKPDEILSMSLLRVVRKLSGSGFTYAASVRRLLGSPSVRTKKLILNNVPLVTGPIKPCFVAEFQGAVSRQPDLTGMVVVR